MYSDLKSLMSAAKPLNDEPTAPNERNKLLNDVLFFPHSQKRRAVDEAAQIQRTECLTALSNQQSVVSSQIIVTYPEAVAEPVPAKEDLERRSLKLRVNDSVQLSVISGQLADLGFERVDFVFQPGQYAIRGGILDIYSYSHDNPYRLDFFGDEIDSIREFDIEDQLSKTRLQEADIVGGNQESGVRSQETTIVDYLSDETVWVSNDWSVVKFKMEGLGLEDALLQDGKAYRLQERTTIEINEKSSFATHSKITFETQPQPVFHKQFDILTDDLKRHVEKGYKVYILAEQQKQLDRLAAIMSATLNDEMSEPTALNDGMFIGINATLQGSEDLLLHGPPDLRAVPPCDDGERECSARQGDHHPARDQPVADRRLRRTQRPRYS